MYFYLVGLHFCFLITLLKGNVIIRNNLNETLITFLSRSSTFGPEIQSDGFIGVLLPVDPIDACNIVRPPPRKLKYPWIALIQRHNCSFINKVLNVQAVGFEAAIVYNTESDALIRMQGRSIEAVIIPSTFIGKTSGRIISEYFRTNYSVMIIDDSVPTSMDLLMLIPFAVIIPICLIIIIVLLSLRCISARKKNSRLSQSQLKRLPLERFKTGDRYDVCAVCLEEYREGDKLRILPCSHTYHQKCIDPWLTGTKQTCPLCNKAVFPEEEDASNNEESNIVDEQTPLIRNVAPTHNLSAVEVSNLFGHLIIDSSSDDDDERDADDVACILDSHIEVHNQPHHQFPHADTITATGYNQYDNASCDIEPEDSTDNKALDKKSCDMLKPSFLPLSHVDGGDFNDPKDIHEDSYVV